MAICTANEVFASPNLYPVQIDIAREVVLFVPLTREEYSTLSFLDRRLVTERADVFECSLGALADVEPVATRIVLHSAYCCSTLLTRYLDRIPGCMALREPALLTQLALCRPRVVPDLRYPIVGAQDWSRMLTIAMRLLSRTWAPHDVVVMKANDCCTSIGAQLAQGNASSRLLYMTSTLRTFLLAAIRNGGRREWLHTRMKVAALDAADIPELSGIHPDSLTDAQAAAYIWLLNQLLYRKLQSSMSVEQVKKLHGERLSDFPNESMQGALDHFAIAHDESALPRMDHHAKDLSRAYDNETRRLERAALEMSFGREADGGLQWAAKLAPDLVTGEPAG